jgi:hypothetical protein
MNSEGYRTKQPWPNWSIVSERAWRDCENHDKRTVGVNQAPPKYKSEKLPLPIEPACWITNKDYSCTSHTCAVIPCSRELQRVAYSSSKSRHFPPFMQPGNALPLSPDSANSYPDKNGVNSLSVKFFIHDTNKCAFDIYKYPLHGIHYTA